MNTHAHKLIYLAMRGACTWAGAATTLAACGACLAGYILGAEDPREWSVRATTAEVTIGNGEPPSVVIERVTGYSGTSFFVASAAFSALVSSIAIAWSPSRVPPLQLRVAVVVAFVSSRLGQVLLASVVGGVSSWVSLVQVFTTCCVSCVHALHTDAMSMLSSSGEAAWKTVESEWVRSMRSFFSGVAGALASGIMWVMLAFVTVVGGTAVEQAAWLPWVFIASGLAFDLLETSTAQVFVHDGKRMQSPESLVTHHRFLRALAWRNAPGAMALAVFILGRL